MAIRNEVGVEDRGGAVLGGPSGCLEEEPGREPRNSLPVPMVASLVGIMLHQQFYRVQAKSWVGTFGDESGRVESSAPRLDVFVSDGGGRKGSSL